MAEQVDPQATTSDTSATSSDSSDTVVSNKTINEGQWRPKELARMRDNDADCTNVPKASRLSTSEASGYQANDPIKLEQEPPIDIPIEPAKSPEYDPFATIPSTPKPDEASMFSKPKPDEASCWPKPVLDARVQPPSLFFAKRSPMGNVAPPPEPVSPASNQFLQSPKAYPRAASAAVPPDQSMASSSGPCVGQAMPEPSDQHGTKKTGWKAKLVFFAVLWDAKDWATTDAIVSKFQADLAKHPLQPNQAWGRSAQQLVDHYAAGHWDAVPSLLETMKANLHFAREYTRTQNIMNRHGSDARRPDWFDIRATANATICFTQPDLLCHLASEKKISS